MVRVLFFGFSSRFVWCVFRFVFFGLFLKGFNENVGLGLLF